LRIRGSSPEIYKRRIRFRDSYNITHFSTKAEAAVVNSG
jgi:hypothetical protein